MSKFTLYYIVSDIKEIACILFKVIAVVSIMLAPFFLVHLIETCF